MTHTDIHLLLTGDELMSGDTVDSNSSMIAQSLSAYGHSVVEKVTLGDDRTRLIRALERAAGVARVDRCRTRLGVVASRTVGAGTSIRGPSQMEALALAELAARIRVSEQRSRMRAQIVTRHTSG